MLYLGVIIYNSYIKNSKIVIDKLTNREDSTVIFFDNSSEKDIRKQNNEFIEREKDCVYISIDKNAGLSVAYNKIIDYIKNKDSFRSEHDYIMWIDDDTNINKLFFEKVHEGIKEGYDIILPKIIGQDGIIYSPNESGKIKNKLVLNNHNTINYKKINGINSCLTIKISLFNNYKYDENLFLDQVDQLFFDHLRGKVIRYLIIDVLISQNFSQRNGIKKDSYLQRFSIRKKDILQYGKISPYNNVFLCKLKILFLGINFTIESRSFSYLLEAIK